MKTNLNVDTQALREKILDLAMRGKLVTQDPGDEPASVLLEKIKVEKAELVKEGKIKKSKKLSKITDDEKPFEIPDSWEWVRLGDIGDLSRGRSKHRPRGDKLLYTDGKYPFVQTGDVAEANKYLTKYKLLYNDLGLEQSKMWPKGTLCITIAANIGDVAILNFDACFPDSVVGFTPYLKEISSEYFYYLLLRYKPILDSKSSQVAQKNLSVEKLSSIPFPLPPLDSQQRIAVKIRELFLQIDVIEKNVAEYQGLEQAMRSKLLDLAMRGKLVEQDPSDEPAGELLKQIQAEKTELVKEGKIKKSKKLPEITDDEKPFDIPNGWEWVRLGDVTRLNTGKTPSKKNVEYYGGSFPFIKPGNISNSKIDYNTEDTLTDIGISKSQQALQHDILITCIGNLGRNFVVDRPVGFNQQINSVRSFCIDYMWLHYALLSDMFLVQMNNAASATTVTILNKNKLRSLCLPLPPMEEQKRIVAKLEELFEQLDIINNNLVSAS